MASMTAKMAPPTHTPATRMIGRPVADSSSAREELIVVDSPIYISAISCRLILCMRREIKKLEVNLHTVYLLYISAISATKAGNQKAVLCFTVS